MVDIEKTKDCFTKNLSRTISLALATACGDDASYVFPRERVYVFWGASKR